MGDLITYSWHHMKVALWCPLFPEQEILFTNRLFEFGNLAKRLSHLCQSALFVCWFLCSSCFFSLQKDFRICSKVHYLCADFFVLHASFAWHQNLFKESILNALAISYEEERCWNTSRMRIYKLQCHLEWSSFHRSFLWSKTKAFLGVRFQVCAIVPSDTIL